MDPVQLFALLVFLILLGYYVQHANRHSADGANSTNFRKQRPVNHELSTLSVNKIKHIKQAIEARLGVVISDEALETATADSLNHQSTNKLPPDACQAIRDACEHAGIDHKHPQGVALGLIFQSAARAKAQCRTEHAPIVMPADVLEVARGWQSSAS